MGARLKLVDAVIMPSILYNVECYPTITSGELHELESLQAEIIAQIMEVPRTTPYAGMLMETGLLTMEARIAYKKLMLFQNIMMSDEDRMTRVMVKVQIEEDREGTW